ncbi:uncharacterized protein LOC119386786 [Rhipicephalus sanguineus]|uniref:uncharacterized protein LOC119386786 n=1 Tax=Rhipicephalus sanguineus TaxID=34632 RepID=UPI0018947F3F|nr:uncharacterized protein LOC119386786 [Rhipicephalus sanguineus]
MRTEQPCRITSFVGTAVKGRLSFNARFRFVDRTSPPTKIAMTSAVGTTRLLILAAALITVLLMAAPLVAEAAARQFCSPNGDVCFGPLDCCSGQCVNAVCCDELLGTCPFDYFGGPYWKRNSNAVTPTVPTTEPEESSTTSAPESSTHEEEPEESSTQDSR